MFNKIFQWVVFSSADPERFSLTLKAGLALLVLLGVGNITPDMQNEFVNDSAKALVKSGELISAVITAFGAARKVYLSIVG